ncbi:unnamed protein product [Trichogramma brassicae]|uniref:Uncharacterized protein n=1 Tax=Trichogramma brassicae TaxID=86971 RepID=A0A6H5J049_9HYME|nr:unnamed protein product [Trichogramma brassicae]
MQLMQQQQRQHQLARGASDADKNPFLYTNSDSQGNAFTLQHGLCIKRKKYFIIQFLLMLALMIRKASCADLVRVTKRTQLLLSLDRRRKLIILRIEAPIYTHSYLKCEDIPPSPSGTSRLCGAEHIPKQVNHTALTTIGSKGTGAASSLVRLISLTKFESSCRSPSMYTRAVRLNSVLQSKTSLCHARELRADDAHYIAQDTCKSSERVEVNPILMHAIHECSDISFVHLHEIDSRNSKILFKRVTHATGLQHLQKHT